MNVPDEYPDEEFDDGADDEDFLCLLDSQIVIEWRLVEIQY